MDNGIIGEVRLFAGYFAPKGWIYCHGQALSSRQFPVLASLLGTVFGGGGDSFCVPDLRGRVAIGAGEGPGMSKRERGDKGGAASVTLNMNEMPQHTANVSAPLTVKVSKTAATVTEPAHNFMAATAIADIKDYNQASPDITLNDNTVAVSLSGLTQGGGVGHNAPHDNRQPYMGIDYIICLEGSRPTQGS